MRQLRVVVQLVVHNYCAQVATSVFVLARVARGVASGVALLRMTRATECVVRLQMSALQVRSERGEGRVAGKGKGRVKSREVGLWNKREGRSVWVASSSSNNTTQESRDNNRQQTTVEQKERQQRDNT